MKKIYLILLLFLATRLVNLTLLPIFIDEANYLDWGWRETHTKNFLFYSLYDAKPPGIMWLYGLFQSVISNPLLAGRLVTVLFGLLTLIGLYFVSPTASILYVVTPIFLFFDRQALMETPLSAIGVWSYFLLTKLRAQPSYRLSLFLGAVLGIGLFIKTNVLLFLIPSLLLSPTPVHAIFCLLSFFTVSSPLLFQPMFWSTLSSNSRFSMSLPELLRFPVLSWLQNLWAYLQISFWHLTPPILAAIILGLRKFPKTFLIYSFMPLAALVAVSRTPSSRYLVSFLPLLLIPAADFFSSHRRLFYISLVPGVLLTGVLIFSPPHYFRLLDKFTPYSDIGYLTGDNSGYQVNATLKYLQTLETPFIAAIAANSGNPEAAILNYFHTSKTIQVVYFDSKLLKIEPGYDCLASSPPLYFIARKTEQAGLEKFFAVHATITNPYNSDFNTIYTLRSDCPPEKTLPLTGAR